MIESMAFKAVEARIWRLKIFSGYALSLTALKIFAFKTAELKNS